MKFLLICLMAVLIIVLSGCSTTPFVPPASCDGADSFILKTIPDVKALSKGLLVVQVTALNGVKGYEVGDAVEVLNQIEVVVDSVNVTYAGVVAVIMNKLNIANSLAGAAIFIVGDDILLLDKPVTISPCDLDLIKLHLARQRALLMIYGSGS